MRVLERKFGHINDKPALSVIVVAYKTGHELDDCLASLEAQKYKYFEVIVVDNDNEDLNMLKKYDIRYFKLGKNYGPSYARNFGAKHACGEILAFLDDDAIADEDWTLGISNTFKDRSVVSLRGRISLKSRSTYYNRLPRVYDLGNQVIESPPNTEGNSAVRRSDFLESGGYNELLYGMEGTDLSYRLKGRGVQLYVPDVRIFHDSGDSLKHFWKREFRSGYNSTHILLNYPQVIAHRKSFGDLTGIDVYSNFTTKQKIQSAGYDLLAKIAYHFGSTSYKANVIALKRRMNTHI